MKRCDVLIAGAGIIGLTLALQIKRRLPSLSVVVIEKESSAAFHASSRNSGVLHSGIYYSSSSLKAKFCIEGNRRMREYCELRSLPINRCGKLVVATTEEECSRLEEIRQRATQNGCNVQMLSREAAEEIEPNIRMVGDALFAPDTATIDPVLVCASLQKDIVESGVELHLSTMFHDQRHGEIVTSRGEYLPRCFINCAGLYADKIAHMFGKGSLYTLLPFKGLYLKYSKNKSDVRTNIYPVPDPKFPFLGVHFTKTVDGTIKIGPTAIPGLWRENYDFSSRFRWDEFVEIMLREAELFLTNSFHFRKLAIEEMKKYRPAYFVGLAERLVKKIDAAGFGEFTTPGIRAQLLNKNTRELVQDFVIEADESSIHVLNAVSPGFTCSFPFADHIIDSFLHSRFV